MAANSVLGSSFILIIPIRATMEGILCQFKKKQKASALTFSPEVVCRKTCVGHFISSTIQKIPTAKKQKLDKIYERAHQTYIDVTVSGNHHGNPKHSVFLENLWSIICVFFGLDRSMLFLSYPDCATTSKNCPMQGDTYILSSLTQARMYVDKIYIWDDEESPIKLFVAHDKLSVSFNSSEYRSTFDDVEGSITVSSTQASTTVVVGFFAGSCYLDWSAVVNPIQHLP